MRFVFIATFIATVEPGTPEPRTMKRPRGVLSTTVALAGGLVMTACGDQRRPSDGPIADGGPSLIATDENLPPPLDFDCPDATTSDAASPPQPFADPLCANSDPGIHFGTDVLPVIRGCFGEVCHDGWSYQSTVDVPAWECCDRRKLVDPGHPSRSYLLQKVKGTELCGNSGQMGNLAPERIAAITQWICLGAPND